LRINQVRNEVKKTTSNYFAIQSLNKFNEQSEFNSNSRFGSTKSDFIKPSTFNLNLNDCKPALTPNYSNALLSRPSLHLDRINYFGTSSQTITNQPTQQDIFNSNLSSINNSSINNLPPNSIRNKSNNVTNNIIDNSVHINLNINFNRTSVMNLMNESNVALSTISNPCIL
jgi:hypothetical protein